MGFNINTNIASMNAFRNSNFTNLAVDKSLTSLSSGLRISKASDDASGMAIANSLRSQANALGQSIQNANDGIGLLQTADGALEEYTKIIDTIRVKAIQAASGGQSLESRKKIQEDIGRLLEEAQNIATTTQFNGQSLLNGAFKNRSFHVGAYSGQDVKLSIENASVNEIAKGSVSSYDYTTSSAFQTDPVDGGNGYIELRTADGTILAADAIDPDVGVTQNSSQDIADVFVINFNTEATDKGKNITASAVDLGGGEYGVELTSPDDNFTVEKMDNWPIGNIDTDVASTPTAGVSLAEVDVTTRVSADEAIDTTDRALADIDDIRSDFGSVQNQLESTIRNISTTQVNVAAAESQLRDVDFAAESENFAKLNIMAQSGSYALSQANATPNSVMSLLESSA